MVWSAGQEQRSGRHPVTGAVCVRPVLVFLSKPDFYHPVLSAHMLLGAKSNRKVEVSGDLAICVPICKILSHSIRGPTSCNCHSYAQHSPRCAADAPSSESPGHALLLVGRAPCLRAKRTRLYQSGSLPVERGPQTELGAARLALHVCAPCISSQRGG